MQTPRLSLVDMNNGVTNEATRCFRRLFGAFSARVRAANPGLSVELEHVQPRNLGELPVSRRGPRPLLRRARVPPRRLGRAVVHRVPAVPGPDDGAAVHGTRTHRPGRLPGLPLVRDRGPPLPVAPTWPPREQLKFAIFPAYVTAEGRQTASSSHFGDRLFIWEHRDLAGGGPGRTGRLREHGGALLASESRPGRCDKGRALLAFRFGPGLDGTQFHPEADRPG